VPYQLLQRFEALFSGCIYRHRSSTNGDHVAVRLYEDLLALGRSPKFVHRVQSGTSVVNVANTRAGIKARRGDGSFGERLPHVAVVQEEGLAVGRGPIATIEIGVETKILAKAMIKQIDRVISDLENQARVFRSKGGNPICVAVVGINRAPEYLSYEGDRTYRTTGAGGYHHPAQEFAEAERRIRQHVSPHYDELIVLPFVATNQPPHDFTWINSAGVANDYAGALLRISQKYEQLF